MAGSGVTAQVARCDAAGFRPWVADAAHVYGAAMERPAEVVAQRRHVMDTHLERDGVRCTVALEEGRLVGFGYAYRGAAGQWWHDIVATGLGREQAETWLGDALEVVELHVLPSHQGRGLGRQMLHLLLDGATEATVVLSTPDRETAARHLYRSEGFADLLTGFCFPTGAERYAVMGKRLRSLDA